MHVFTSGKKILVQTTELQIFSDPNNIYNAEIININNRDKVKKFYSDPYLTIFLTEDNNLYIESSIIVNRFILLKKNVTNFIAHNGTILFAIHNKYLYAYDYSQTDIISKTFELKKFDTGKMIHHKLIIPDMFNSYTLEFNKDYLLIRSDDNIAIVICSNNIVDYYYHSEINEQDIKIDNNNSNVYYLEDNNIHYYNTDTNELMFECITVTEKEEIVYDCDDNMYRVFHEKDRIAIITEKRYFSIPTKKSNMSIKHIITNNFICASWDVEDNEEICFFTKNNQILINLIGFDRCYYSNLGIWNYDNNNLFLYSIHELYSSIPDTIYSGNNRRLFVYKMTLPSDINIKTIHYTHKFILIEEINSKLHYININDWTGKSYSLTMRKNFMDVQTSLVSRKRKINEYDANINIYVEAESPKLARYMAYCEMTGGKIDCVLRYVNKSVQYALGDGVKKDFMHQAINEFITTYCIKESVFPQLNAKLIRKTFTNVNLYYIGMMLHYTVINLQNPLEHHLPLMIIEKLIGYELMIEELEYFANHQDENAFNQIKLLKDFDDEKFNSYTGYDNYKFALESVCKMERNDDVYEIIDEMSKGILKCREINNITHMNAPTLDYYFSGSIEIDKSQFINKIIFFIKDDSFDTKPMSDEHDYVCLLIKMIDTFSNAEIKILLKNWSGSTNFSPDNKYNIYIENITRNRCAYMRDADYINFQTCTCTLSISESLMKKFDYDIMKLQLTTLHSNIYDDY